MKSKSILIVEDNDLNRQFFENLIGQIWDYESALNGREAIEKVEKRSFDLILMDIQMPEIDGITALKKIKGGNLASCPIIAVTAFADESDRSNFLNQGFDDFITKPIRPKEFLERIKKNLQVNNRRSEISRDQQVIRPLTLDPDIKDQLSKYNNPKTIHQIYLDFEEETAALLEASKNEYLQGNVSEVMQHCHIIKGNSGTLGVNLVYLAALEAEHAARLQKTDELGQALRKLEKEFASFQKYLAEETIFKS